MSSKTRKYLLIVALVVAAVLILPNRYSSFRGFYQPNLGVAICDGDPKVCRHEVGHIIDAEMGHPSQTEAFGTEVFIYLHTQLYLGGTTDVTNAITGTPGIMSYSVLYKPFHLESFSSPQEEMYANIYASVDGDISKLPHNLQRFFRGGKEYDEIHAYLVENKFYTKEIKSMNEKLNELVEKVKANKKIVIRVGIAVGVAALTATGVALAIHLKNERDAQAEFENEELTRLSELEEEEETEE